MTVNHPITVDLVQPGLTPRLYAMQHDANSRVIVFTLTQAGQPWEAPAGAIFGLSYRKTDGTRGYYTENITCTASQICVSVAPQVLTCPGTVDAALVCNAADGSRIAAFPLQIQVRPDPAAGKTDSDDYFNPTDALRYTPQDLTEAQKQQARANLGIGAAADTWRYNGYALPPLPDWDKETYPYAVISLRESIGLYYLSVHKAIRYFEGIPILGSSDRNTNFGDSTPGTALLYTWQEGMAAWELFDKDNWSISVERDDTGKDIALWANFDLLDDAGELYVGASEPVEQAAGVTLRYIPLSLRLSTAEASSLISLSAGESALLTAAAESRMPCILSMIYNTVPVVFVATYMYVDGMHAYVTNADPMYMVSFMEMGNGWKATVKANF